MSLVIRENLSSIAASANRPIGNSASLKAKVGKVFGIADGENKPTKKQFEKIGGYNALGTVFYLNYDISKDIDLNKITDLESFFDNCSKAKPFSTETSYPLENELVLIQTLPAAYSQVSSAAVQEYYLGTIAVWNNAQHNAQPANDTEEFKDFQINENSKNLLRFPGDKITQGRNGNSIRFGGTVRSRLYNNEWSKGPGQDGDPIVILSNGQDVSNTPYHIEQINKEYSSIYLTSSQTLPLIIGKKGILNPLTNPVSIDKYYKPQIIVNSDRVIINSKKDEVIISAQTNIEICTENIINLNATNRVHLNSGKIFLGTDVDGTLPDEPLVKGIQLTDFLSDLLLNLSIFCSKLSKAKSTPEGSELVDIQTAAEELNEYLQDSLKYENFIKKLLSDRNYTI